MLYLETPKSLYENWKEVNLKQNARMQYITL